MKKLIFCCLVILMGACKDKNKDVEPEPDFAPEFVGKYETTTVAPSIVTKQAWDVTVKEKNQLNILYNKNTEVKVPGTSITLDQEYSLVNVKSTSKDVFEINEIVDVKQSNGKPLQQKVQGIATKVVNAAGVPQINITIKFSDPGTGAVALEEYLEFKKK
ncbi:hypothetical protein [Dyadobacter pollutisoli]|uniref:Uncharacterized protein n=1 Tax=Dyadobacter pollutisoli TaxID=2910158 RepID=A0A9E8SJ19_9BACT|nr:hypothetical protein [Dyadobacter pollutisoli]WAC09271.1 hypothetical protein ON006_16080 [Dyadobacter pollutisoli]